MEPKCWNGAARNGRASHSLNSYSSMRDIMCAKISLILWSRLHSPTKSTYFAYEADFIGRWSQLHFWGGCLYVFQTLIAHGVMVAYYVVTLVELGGDTSAYSWVVNHSTCLLAIGWWLSDMPFNWFISFCLAAKRALKSEESRKDYTNEEFLAQQPVVGSLAMRLCADSSYGFRFWFHTENIEA